MAGLRLLSWPELSRTGELVTRDGGGPGGRDLYIIYDLIPGTLGGEKAIGRADRGWKMGGTAWGC